MKGGERGPKIEGEHNQDLVQNKEGVGEGEEGGKCLGCVLCWVGEGGAVMQKS